MTNILEAIINITETPVFEIKNHYLGRNRVNNIGEALETFVKDAFANLIDEADEQIRMKRYSEVFSWCGNQNHPPDIMIKGGDAIEVKKTQGVSADLALNSSYPKATLRSDSLMITADCKTCEIWTEKDLIYVVGHTTDVAVNSIWMVYGTIYAAKHETYQIIKDKISEGIKEIPNVQFAVTKELGRVNRVDPLGISSLRIRGMWTIQNPRKVFSYIPTPPKSKFELVAIIPLDKYNSFSSESIKNIENIDNENLSIEDITVLDPNNPAKSINAKLIKFIVP